MNTHKHKVGMRFRLVDTSPCGRYDGTECGTGIIKALSWDDSTPSYTVLFDDGTGEDYLYADEFEVENENS